MSDEFFSPEEGMPLEERKRYYNEQVSQMVQFGYDNAPAVKNKLDGAGVKPSQIRTTNDLELVPYITRDEILTLQAADPPYGGLLAVPVESLFKIVYSPGPMYVPIGSPEASAGGARKVLHSIGLRQGDRAILSMPTLFNAGSGCTDALVLDNIVFVPAGAGNTELQVTMIRDLGIKGYIGTPTFLMNMLQKAEELGFDFKKEFKLSTAVVWGEPLLPEVRKTFENKYGIRIADGIGAGPGFIFGCECGEKNGIHVTEEQFIEIIDLDTGKQLQPGELGAVAVTTLNNFAFPMIRYATGDLSRLSVDPCPCGRTSPRMMGVLGRVGDSTKVRAIYLTPGQVKAVVSRFPAISKCQVRVTRKGYKDEMVLYIELADDAVDRATLSKEFQADFRSSARLRIDKIDFVATGTIPDDYKTIVDERVRHDPYSSS